MAEQSPPGALFGLGKDDRRLLERIEKRVEELQKKLSREIETAAKTAVERHQQIMATQAELQAAIEQLDTTLTAEVDQINAKLDELRGQVAPNLQPQVDAIKASTARISGIIADAVPEPGPAPPEGRRR